MKVRRQSRLISGYLISFILMAAVVTWEFGNAQSAELPGRCNRRLEALALALKLTPAQMEQASAIIKADESAKETLQVQFRRRYEYLERKARKKDTSDSQIRSACRAIAEIQEQWIYQDAKTQVALRGLLTGQQLEVFNQMALTKEGPPRDRPLPSSKSELSRKSCSPRKAPPPAP